MIALSTQRDGFAIRCLCEQAISEFQKLSLSNLDKILKILKETLITINFRLLSSPLNIIGPSARKQKKNVFF